MPDVLSEVWFAHGQSQPIWRRNWEATGDSGRHYSHGPAPLGWSSFAQTEVSALATTASRAMPAREPVLVRPGSSRLATWTRYDYRAPGLMLTYRPGRRVDGFVGDGPPWHKVLYRQTFDMHTGQLLHECSTKGMSIEEASGPIPGTKGKCRDIITTFVFRPGRWRPDESSQHVPAMPVTIPGDKDRSLVNGAVSADGGYFRQHTELESPSACGASVQDAHDQNNQAAPGESPAPAVPKQAFFQGSFPHTNVQDVAKGSFPREPARMNIPMEVQRLQAAMGAPVSDLSDFTDAKKHMATACLPQLSPEQEVRLQSLHRDRHPSTPPLFNACVARPVSKEERNRTPAALEAVAKEWKRLRSIKHKKGVGVWDETRVREKAAVRREARRDGITVHFARIFDLCVEKGSELPDGHPDKKFKGRAVLQGDQVKDQDWQAALFQDLSSSPAAMEASRAADAYGMSEGHDIEVADADQAYT